MEYSATTGTRGFRTLTFRVVRQHHTLEQRKPIHLTLESQKGEGPLGYTEHSQASEFPHLSTYPSME